MKKIFSFVVIFILMLSFTGCGSDNSMQNSQEKSASVEKKVEKSNDNRQIRKLQNML